MAFKVVVADPKTGKSYKMETEEKSLLGLKIGEKFPGDALKLNGYELEFTGGSDKTGTPMRRDVKGSAPRRLLLTDGVGFHADKPGERRKKRVLGYKIGADIVQVNFKVVKAGAQPLEKLIVPEKKEEAPKEGEAPAEGEKPAEAPKEEPKPEEKPAEEAKPAEKPAEEKKEKPKLEAPVEKPAEESKPAEPPKEEPPAEEKKEEPVSEEKKE